MTGTRKTVSMGFTREHFPEGTHMCLIYDNEDQRRKTIKQFLARGIADGERAGYFAEQTTLEEVRSWLKEMGIDLARELEKGAFQFFPATDVYCPSGVFSAKEMLARLGGFYTTALEEGFTGARVSGEMSWALKGIPGSDQLLEYEALINTVSEHQPVTPICQYNANLFDGATLLNVLKVHPLMIVQEQIVRNPYYMPPDEFLKEYNHVH